MTIILKRAHLIGRRLVCRTDQNFGPGFQDARSRLYRAEYGALTVAVAGYLLWRGVFIGGVDIWQTVLWVVFPDIVSFVPIGVSSKQGD